MSRAGTFPQASINTRLFVMIAAKILLGLLCANFVRSQSDSATPFTLTILHTNDVHSHIEESSKYGGLCTEDLKREGKCYGGVARIVTKVT